jgi:hypothetical protein
LWFNQSLRIAIRRLFSVRGRCDDDSTMEKSRRKIGGLIAIALALLLMIGVVVIVLSHSGEPRYRSSARPRRSGRHGSPPPAPPRRSAPLRRCALNELHARTQ